ncbi:TPA: phenoxybenzoate dioxygenase, partial [Klebsiella pneumoniae]|nr:phenoxybenzoate dioxygenase [Klebsiella pneumoniae]
SNRQRWCRGAPADRKAIWFQLRDGVLTGAVTLNHGREIRTLRKLIQSGQAVNAETLCDESVPLKTR